MNQSTAIGIIATLSALLVGGAAFVLWFVRSDTQDRKKHYRMVITVKPDGKLGIYKSRLAEMYKRPIVIVPGDDFPVVRLDIKMLDASVKVVDIREERG